MAQAYEKTAQQMAASEAQNHYPDVYRSEEDLRNHAYAIAQQQVRDTSADPFAVQQYAEAYMAAYRHAVEERDAQK